MRKIILAVSIFLMFNSALYAIEPVNTGCSPASCNQQFSVIGYGKMPYNIDLVDIQFSVSVRDNDAESSKRKHDKIMVKVNKYLKEKEFPDGILSLQSSTLQRQNSSSGKRDDDFYLARSAYLIHTDRVQDMNSLQMELVEIGVDEIQSVTLLSSKQRQMEDEARKLALKDAIEKADLTAKTLGLKLGKPTSVSYIDKSWYLQQKDLGTKAITNSSGDAPFAASGNFVEVMVKLTFSFQAEANTQETTPADAGKPQQQQ